MCNTSIYVFVKQYTIHGLTYVDMHVFNMVYIYHKKKNLLQKLPC